MAFEIVSARRVAENLERRLHFESMGVAPFWMGQGRLGWRWRAMMALRAIAGYELGGWR